MEARCVCEGKQPLLRIHFYQVINTCILSNSSMSLPQDVHVPPEVKQKEKYEHLLEVRRPGKDGVRNVQDTHY